MTSNTQIPNGEAAPVWQPTRPTADAEASAAGTATDDDAAASTGAVEFAPGHAARPRAKAKGRRGGSTTALLMIGALVAVGGVGFAVGHNLSGGSGGNAAANGQNGFRPDGSFNPGQARPDASGFPDRGLGGAGTVTGTVESVSADSMTIKLASGQTVTVAIGSSTTYHNQTSASSSTVTTGSTVIVQTSGGSQPAVPGASASPGTGTTNRTATDVTVTSN